ncbi:MAG: hypothetical protein HFJ10_15925 [Lachnospiraceae bacterium]|nr:hypothetical protein [Lachnospiraceae bacterium]
MTDRIYSERMKKCVEGKCHTVIGYLTAGYPNEEAFFEVIKECCKRGLSILEIGFPSANPSEDGEVIRRAHRQVGTQLCKNMDFWRRLRSEVSVPIWLMGYEKDLIQTGIYRKMAEEGLYDVLVLSDAETKERMELKSELMNYSVDVAGFVSNDDSFHEVVECRKEFGIIYQRLYTGPTGEKNNSRDYGELLDYSQMSHQNLIFGGFGITSGDRARELLERGFDGVIVGTEMMRRLNNSREELYEFVEELVHVDSSI